MRTLHPSESQEQKTLFQWLELESRKHPELKLAFAIPNGGLRNVITARRMKLEGVKPGVPDIFLPVPRGGYHGMFIEMKKVGGRATKEQLEWMADLLEQGYWCEVCYGWERASSLILNYIAMPATQSVIGAHA